MKMLKKTATTLFVVTVLCLSCQTTATAQHQFKGQVLSQGDKLPLSYATVIMQAGRRNISTVTDSTGKYTIPYGRAVRSRDSAVFSAIGHKAQKVALTDLTAKTQVWLEPNSNMLENVVILSSLTGSHARFGYYRGWREKNNHGEIGQVLQLPDFDKPGPPKIQIGAVQVKVNHNYDTCMLKLHIRDVWPGGLPQNDLLKQEVIIQTSRTDGLIEFDLGWKEFTFPSGMIYIGFEVLSCSSPASSNPSFSFVGSEEGENLYRDAPEHAWMSGSKYTIYIKFEMK
jgi:hypothetical protein